MRFQGKIVRGKGIGKTINFPTLNFEIPDDFDLEAGVYAARVQIPPSPPLSKGGNGTKWSGGILFFGNRETFDNSLSLEIHLLETSVESPPESAKVEVLDKIREVNKFENEEELKKQIEKDCTTASQVLKNVKSKS